MNTYHVMIIVLFLLSHSPNFFTTAIYIVYFKHFNMQMPHPPTYITERLYLITFVTTSTMSLTVKRVTNIRNITLHFYYRLCNALRYFGQAYQQHQLSYKYSEKAMELGYNQSHRIQFTRIIINKLNQVTDKSSQKHSGLTSSMAHLLLSTYVRNSIP